MKKQHNYTVMHWGTWQVESREGDIVAVNPVPWDKIRHALVSRSPTR